MQTKYLQEQVRCPKCNKKTRKLIAYDGIETCYDCFVSNKNKKFLEENPNYAKKIVKRKMFEPVKAPGKSIYAINGVTCIYHGGCTN